MTTLLIVVYSLCGIYMIFNMKHDLHMLQQNSYRLKRYWRYLTYNDLSSTWRLADLAMLFLVFSRFLNVAGVAIFLGIYCILKIILIFQRKFKKPLVFTKRVWRIYSVAAAIFIGLFLWAIFILGFQPQTEILYTGPSLTFGIFLLMSIFSWFFVFLSVIILIPVETSINNGFIKDAKKILKGMPQLTVIGITGSFGKTSTKNFLKVILSRKFDVLMTPGSYNTPMGVVRTIREMLKPYHKVFICEMGAKQTGDIKEICDIVHPKIGIVTAVGAMHLETFKTIDNVCSTKFELIDALPEDGYGVVNKDFDECKNRKVINVECVYYTTYAGDSNLKDFQAYDIKYSNKGTYFKVRTPKGEVLELNTKLLGECNISDLLGAIVIALKLDVPVKEIQRGVSSIQPVEHRLSFKTTPGGVTILDDAFNSNPVGSKMALETLKNFDGGKRIVVTPGMIELGSRQFAENKNFGTHIANCVDVAIIVGEYNRKAILEGIESSQRKPETVIEAENFNEAQKYLSKILKEGDTVLYENDLPDSFK